MAVDRLASFLDAVRESRLLQAAQLDELSRDAKTPSSDPQVLARRLVQRGWLTRFQATVLLQGRGKHLTLGPYSLLDRLGEGGMGQVFKAHHQPMNRIVALKVIRKDKLANPESVQRFYREVQAAAQLSHPNIVLAYDAGQVGSVHFFAMEYVEGIDLARLVKEAGPLPIARACDFIRQAALGLQHAHERGWVHRDLKPANLLVTRSPRVKPGGTLDPVSATQSDWALVKILDMGLARLQDGRGKDTSLTEEGRVMGTPDYLAPEQAMDARHADIRSDLYGLGCTFYYLLTGKPPFQGNSLPEVLLKHQMDTPEPLERLRPEVPPAVAAIVSRLMAKRPEERYQTPLELVEALESCCREKGGVSAPAAATGATLSAHVEPDWRSLTAQSTERNVPELDFAFAGTEDDTGSPPLVQTLKATGDPTGRRRKLMLLGVAAGGLLSVVGFVVLAVFLSTRGERPEPEVPSPAERANEAQVRAEHPEPAQPTPSPQPRLTQGPLPGPLLPEVGRGEVAVTVNPPAATPAIGRRFAGHRGAVVSAAFSPDARSIMSAGEDHIVRLWNVQTGKEFRHFPVAGALTVAFSRDGRLALTGAIDGSIVLWDVASSRRIRSFAHLKSPVHGLAFSPDGGRALSGGLDKAVSLWDVESGKELKRMEGHGDAVDAVAFSLDGRRALSGSGDLTMRLWDLESGAELRRFEGHQQAVTGVAFSPDGRRALSTSNQQVRVWDVEAGKELLVFKGHAQTVTCIAVSPDNRHALSGGFDGIVRLWDMETGRQIRTFNGHKDRVLTVAFSPDGSLALSGSADQTVLLWPVPLPPAAVTKPLAPRPATDPRAKVPIPDESKQAEAEKLIKDLYKEDYANRRPAEKLALATKLIHKALDTKDDASARFVLLREGRDLAAQAGDISTSLMAINEMARGYAIDAFDMKMSTLSTAASSPNAPALAAGKDIIGQALSLLEEALSADNFEAASRLLTLAETTARKASGSLVPRVEARAKEVGELGKEYQSMKAAAATLQRKPDDPQANLTTGRYLCFRKGQWDKGLPMLSRGSDSTWQTVAKQDLAKPGEPAAQVELADRWWDLAEADGAHKTALRGRACYWYKQALAKLTGLTQTRAEKRLKQALEDAPQLPTIAGELRRFEGHKAKVACVAFSRDGRYALSGSEDGTVRLWDVETGNQVRTFGGSTGEVKTVAFSPDGSRALSGGTDGLWLWDVENGRQIRRLQVGLTIDCVAFTSDGRRAVSGGARGSLQTWMLPEGRAAFGTSNLGWGSIHCLAYSPDDRFILFVPDDGLVHLGSVRDEKEIGKPLRNTSAVLSVAYSPDGHEFATGSAGKGIRVWDTRTGRQVSFLKGHTGPVTSVAFSPNGRQILSGSEDKTVRLWNAKSGQELHRFSWHTDKVWSVAFSPDGHRALSGSSDKTMRLWALPR